jgi:uncharacterized protein YlzI (FlbEa/FlbD family)
MSKNKLIIIFLIILLLLVFLHEFRELFEIKIYDENKPTYNIGDLFNMPSYFYPGWDVLNDVSLVKFRKPYTLDNYMNAYPNSVVYNYYSSRPIDENIPNVKRIRSSVDQYINENSNKFSGLIAKVANNNTLTVHIRSGDKGVVENSYIEVIKKISEKYETIFILSGIHADLVDINECKENLNKSLEKLNIQNVIFNFDEPDIHLSLMRMSSNLLLHKGGFSIIGGLLFQKNNLYISPMFEPKDNAAYRENLQGNVIYM